MSPVLPFDILDLIIGIVGENKVINLLKELALVCHSFLNICSKHLFATVELHDADPLCGVPSSKKGFIKLLKSRPDVVKYIRNLSFKVNRGLNSSFDHDDHPLSSILLTIPRLNCLKIDGSLCDWNSLNSPLRSALVHLMCLPTLNHIDVSYIYNFQLTPSVNLLRLDISNLIDGSLEFVGQSEMVPKIRDLYTSEATELTTKLLHAKMQDGRSAFNFVDLSLLSMSITWDEDLKNHRYLIEKVKSLEILHLSVGPFRSLVGVLSPSARTLKVLNLSIPLYSMPDNNLLPLGSLCEELETMAGDNMLEDLSCEVRVYPNHTKDTIGAVIQNVEKVLVKPGWSSLRLVSFKLIILRWAAVMESEISFKELQSLPDEYLSHLSNLESVAFNYSVTGEYETCR
jgi:hypothetical protein